MQTNNKLGRGRRSQKLRYAVESLETRIVISASLLPNTPSLAFGPDKTVLLPGTPQYLGNIHSNTQTHLTIVPTFDSSITSDPNASAIEAAINADVQLVDNYFADPITVNIYFQEMSSGLGASSTDYNSVSYSSYRAALQSHATTSDDFTALSTLPNSTTNPANGSSTVNATSANLRALGFSAAPQYDSTIGLNTSACNLSRTGTIDSSKYDLMTVALHEMDEALGIGSDLNTSTNGGPSPTGNVTGEDLYRYTSPGVRSFDEQSNTIAYFSDDGGVTDLQQFNQQAGADFNDWFSVSGNVVPQVQNAYGKPGSEPNWNVEPRVLDVLGYTPIVSAPTLTASPTAQTITAGDKVSLFASAIGSPAPLVQWQVSTDGGNTFTYIAGATSNTYSFATTAGQNGYQYRAVFANTQGYANSASAKLTVNAAVSVDVLPYATGISAPLILSANKGATTGSTSFTSSQTIYASFGWGNNGPGTVGDSFAASVYIGGSLRAQYYVGSGLAGGFVSGITNVSLNTIIPGTYSAQLVINDGNILAETNTSNNTYSFNITVTGPSIAPSILYQPQNIAVPSGTTANFTSFAVGGASSPTEVWYAGTGTGNLLLTSGRSVVYSVAADSSENGYDYLAVFTDSTSSTQSNAAFLTVTPAEPNLTPNTVSGWSAPLVYSTTSGVFTDATNISTSQTIFVDASDINTGVGSTTATTTNYIFLDGVQVKTFTDGTLATNQADSLQNFTLGKLAAGTHTLALVVDATNAYTEISTLDNTYATTFTVNQTATTAQPSSGVYGQSTPVTLTGQVTSMFGVINEGTITFSVMNGSTTVATATSGTVSNGSATATLSILGAAFNAGHYQIFATYNGDANYAGSTSPASGDLQIARAQLYVTGRSYERTYATANPAFGYTVSGYLKGDNSSAYSGSPTFFCLGTQSSSTGSYEIVLGTGSLTATNYNFGLIDGFLTIDPAVLTVTATNASRAYGAADPTFSVTYSGFVNGDNSSVVMGTPDFFTSADPTSSPGIYTLYVAVENYSARNYVFSPVYGVLSITPAVLTVTANDEVKFQGAVNPTFGDYVSGFANNETLSVVAGFPSISTTATTTSPIGSYPITITGGSLAASNYTFSFVNGTLNVVVPPPTVVTNAATAIATNGATLNATVNPQNAVAAVAFEYSTDPNFIPTNPTTLGSGITTPAGVAVDAVGDVFVTDITSNTVTEFPANNSPTKTIGSGFSHPFAVAVDAVGNVYVTDTYHSLVKKVLPNGTIQVIGSGFSFPSGIAVDSTGDVFVADSGNNAIKEISPTGFIATLGSGFSSPPSVAVDSAGDVFVGDYGTNSVKEILLNGSIQTIGSGFTTPFGVAVDGFGNVIVGDAGNHVVKEVETNGTIKTIASAGLPYGVAVDPLGNVYIADGSQHSVGKLSSPAVAGNPFIVSGSTATSVSANVTGLATGVPVYYRAVSVGPTAITVGAVSSFVPSSGLPAWLGTGSVATWNASSKALNITGAATIIADPGTDLPTITADGSGAVLTITNVGATHINSLTLTNGAKTIVAQSGNYLGDGQGGIAVYGNILIQANTKVLVINTLSIPVVGAGNTVQGKLDLTNNAMIMNYAGSSSTALTNADGMVKTGSDDGVWDGTGITSSNAQADANNNGYTAIGVADNSDLGYVHFAGQDVSGNNNQQILFMYTYYGNGTLTGTVNNGDLLSFEAGRPNNPGGIQGTGWEYGIFDYGDSPAGSNADLLLFEQGQAGSKQYGVINGGGSYS